MQSASITGVDEVTVQQLTELYFRPPLSLSKSYCISITTFTDVLVIIRISLLGAKYCLARASLDRCRCERGKVRLPDLNSRPPALLIIFYPLISTTLLLMAIPQERQRGLGESKSSNEKIPQTTPGASADAIINLEGKEKSIVSAGTEEV
jgi:hypothetical protein